MKKEKMQFSKLKLILWYLQLLQDIENDNLIRIKSPIDLSTKPVKMRLNVTRILFW